MDTLIKIGIPLAVAIAIMGAFGESAEAATDRPGGKMYGEPGFDSSSVQRGQNTRITGASYVKVGARYYDVQTMKEITYAEAMARAQAEGQALP